MEITERLKELAHAAADQQWREFSMRVPAEPDRDADLVLMRAAMLIEELRRDAARYRWLRDTAVRHAPANKRGEMVWCVIGKNALECSPCEESELDDAIDAAMLKTQNVEVSGLRRPYGEGRA